MSKEFFEKWIEYTGNNIYFLGLFALMIWIWGFKPFLILVCFFSFLFIALSIIVKVLEDLEEGLHIFSNSFNFLGHEIDAFQKTFGKIFQSIKSTDSKLLKSLGYLVLMSIALPIILFTGLLYLLAEFILPIIIFISLICIPLFFILDYFK